MIDHLTFKIILEHTPLVSIDLIVENQDKKYLLGLRNNQPAQNFWFVPGGRIRKDESIQHAFERLVKVELGISYPFGNAKHIGLFEHFYTDNALGESNITTHYVVNAFHMKIDDTKYALTSDNQHELLSWMTTDEILTNVDVHPYTKDYFKL